MNVYILHRYDDSGIMLPAATTDKNKLASLLPADAHEAFVALSDILGQSDASLLEFGSFALEGRWGGWCLQVCELVQ